MGKRLVCVLLSLVLCFLCAGCGGFKADGSFTYLLPQNITSLDPQTATGSAAEVVISTLFEGLCRIDDDGKAVPGVAKSWEANGDNTEFTFHLRKNAKWSDGTPLTAQDFVYGITRSLTPTGSGLLAEDLLLIRGARAYANGEADASALGLEAVDDQTLVIRLEKSSPDLPALTAGAHYMPCNQSYFESCEGHYGLSSEYLLTNGPFTFGSIYGWQTDTGSRSITVTRSDTYQGDHKVAAASVTFLIDYDQSYDEDPVTALVSGNVDVLTLSDTQAEQAEEQDCTLLSLNDAVTGLLLNPRSEKLENAQLRSLFFKSLNRQDLLAQRGNTPEAQGIMPACVLWDGEPYYAAGQTAYTLQDDEALQGISSLLRSLDLEEMPSITVICLDDPESVAVTNTLLAAWNSTLGNAFNLERLTASQFQSRIESGDYEAALYTLRAGGTTPYDVLKSFESTSSPVLLESQEYDQALEALSFDLASYQSAEQLLMDQYVFYPIFQDTTIYAVSPKASGIVVAPDQTVDFTQARKRR
ncbi:MAG: peptide ABC transporter substrate-binding protein [Acutalibacter sp.]|jgi:oligopeptide transport system substrate-binding protein